MLLFHWRKDASVIKTSGDAFFEWFTRCGEAPHGSVREILGVCYFRPLDSKGSVKTAVPSANVNGPLLLCVEGSVSEHFIKYDF